MLQISKIAVCWDMYLSGIPVSHIATQLQVNRDTGHRWIREIKKRGSLDNYLDYYSNCKKGQRAKRKVDPVLKRRIWELREQHRGCCGQKIQYFLKADYNIHISTTTIYKVLREKYNLRSRWKKNQKRGPVPQAHKPREVIQMDTVDFGSVFAFTAVDIFSKEADVLLRPSLEAKDGQAFLHTSMRRSYNKHSDLIQTDGGPEFKAEFKNDVHLFCDRHRYSRPYKKNEQSFIESFNRSLRKECLGWGKYKPNQIKPLTQEVKNWLQYYHYTRPHISLGMKPPLKYD